MSRMQPWPYPLWIAHRGAGKLAPENTLAAFRLGAAHGYRAFECDVKLSADGVPFLLHDATLQRTSSGHGVAGKLDWSRHHVDGTVIRAHQHAAGAKGGRRKRRHSAAVRAASPRSSTFAPRAPAI